MLKSILASLTGFGSDRTVLDAAFALAGLDQGHVAAMHTRIDPGEAGMALNVMEPQLRGELLDAMQRIAREEEERSGQARIAFTDACKRHGASGQDSIASFREITSFENETLHQARLHDIVVMARVPELASERLHTMVMLAGKPVLVPPHRPVQAIGRTVAIAWKDSTEAARTVTAAMPVLEHARQVIVITIAEGAAVTDNDTRTGRASAEGVVALLKRHGVHVQLETGTEGAAPAADAIREICYAKDADLLVAGAYGHSRMREMIFGGVTRSLLKDCDIPVLMVH